MNTEEMARHSEKDLYACNWNQGQERENETEAVFEEIMANNVNNS